LFNPLRLNTLWAVFAAALAIGAVILAYTSLGWALGFAVGTAFLVLVVGVVGRRERDR
jgi:hypothetical protein